MSLYDTLLSQTGQGTMDHLQLGYVVMPPGTGKSTAHLEFNHLVEADSVVNCKATPELCSLRKEAKRTGKWALYDALWIAAILEKLDHGKWVIMVPSVAVGEKMGAQRLACLRLGIDAWARNLTVRGKAPEDYNWGTDFDEESSGQGRAEWIIHPDNQSLQAHLFAIANAFLNGGPSDTTVIGPSTRADIYSPQ